MRVSPPDSTGSRNSARQVCFPSMNAPPPPLCGVRVTTFLHSPAATPSRMLTSLADSGSKRNNHAVVGQGLSLALRLVPGRNLQRTWLEAVFQRRVFRQPAPLEYEFKALPFGVRLVEGCVFEHCISPSGSVGPPPRLIGRRDDGIAPAVQSRPAPAAPRTAGRGKGPNRWPAKTPQQNWSRLRRRPRDG